MIGSGVEHMGHVSFADGEEIAERHGTPFTDKFRDIHAVRGQGLGAELIAEQWEIPRSELDELALRSHQRAHARPTRAVRARDRADEGQRRHRDARSGHPARHLTRGACSLKPAFKPDGRVTAGNASQISDGAAAVLLMAREKADALGVKAARADPRPDDRRLRPGEDARGPDPGHDQDPRRNGMSIDDIDYVEINEAFAPVVAAWQREHKPDMERVNPRGGAMALGHPLGSTGARLITTLLHELEDDDKEIGFVTMCCGGGFGTGTLIQRV